MKLISNRTTAVVVSTAVLIWLTFSVTCPAQTDTTINFGDNIVADLYCPETDTLSFVANAGDRVNIFVTECRDFGGRNCRGTGCFCFEQRVELWTESGTFLATAVAPTRDDNCFDCNYRVRIGPDVLPSDGTYFILVRDSNNDGLGTYGVSLQRTNQPDRAQPLNTEKLGVLNCNEVDTYTFSADSTDSVWIEAVRGDVGNVVPQLELYGIDGQPIAIPGSGVVAARLSRTGVYKLLVYSQRNETGTYQLHLAEFRTPVQRTTWGQLKSKYR